MSDRARIFAACFARSLATAYAGLLIGLALPAYGGQGGELGVLVSLGLCGVAAFMLAATLRADRWGRRRFLIGVSALGALGGLAFAAGADLILLGVAAFAGAINGMGRDRGAALIIEQAILPATATDRERTRMFAWYNVTQDAGHALGSLVAAVPGLLVRYAAVAPEEAYRFGFLVYAGLSVLPIFFYAGLSRAVEASAPKSLAARPLLPETKRVLWRISSLFAIDSLAGGFLTTALVSYFFAREFGVGEEALAPLFAGARVLNAASHLGAAWLAQRIGLVNTMVWTHLPSSLLLATLVIAPSFEVAAVLFLLREGLVEMDVPTRQSYVMALVAPEERTFASGVTNLVRTGAWAVAPSFAGVLMDAAALGAPLVIGAALKVTYDLLLWRGFRHLPPPEERSAAQSATALRRS